MNYQSESGIAIAPILFIVALLAILGAAIAAGAGWLTGGTSNEQATTAAQALVQYSSLLQSAVQRVVEENGCADVQLQFQATNPNAPANGSCNIFSPSGGAIVDQEFSSVPGAFDLTNATTDASWWGTFGHFSQEYNAAFPGIGNSANAQLLFQVPDISLSTCKAINKMVGFNVAGNYAPPSFGNIYESNGYFVGVYSNQGTANNGAYNGFQQFCFLDSSYNIYFYEGLLLAR